MEVVVIDNLGNEEFTTGKIYKVYCGGEEFWGEYVIIIIDKKFRLKSLKKNAYGQKGRCIIWDYLIRCMIMLQKVD